MNSIRTVLAFRPQEMQCQQEIEDLNEGYLQELRLTEAANQIEGVGSRSSHHEIIYYSGLCCGNIHHIHTQKRY